MFSRADLEICIFNVESKIKKWEEEASAYRELAEEAKNNFDRHRYVMNSITADGNADDQRKELEYLMREKVAYENLQGV